MTEAKAEVAAIMGLERMVHELSRLAVLSLLRYVGSTPFMVVHELTPVPRGALTIHMAKLEAAGLVSAVRDLCEGRRRITTFNLTGRGREVIDGYWDTMEWIASRHRAESSSAAAHEREAAS